MSFARGRSFCTSCGRGIKWYDLIPIISWLALGGRCRRCKARLSPRYLIAELVGAAVFALCFAVYGFTFMTPLALAAAALLLAAALSDLSTSEIPNGLVTALIPIAIAAVFIQPEVSLLSRAIGFFAVSLPMLALALAIDGAFGGGDIKLMAVCGFLLGRQNTLLAFFAAVLLGGGFAVYLLISGKRKRGQTMVFGPALCAGVTLAMLYGNDIIGWYMELLCQNIYTPQ